MTQTEVVAQNPRQALVTARVEARSEPGILVLSDSPIATTSALHYPIEFFPVPNTQIDLGQPRTGAHVLITALGREIGVWEITPAP